MSVQLLSVSSKGQISLPVNMRKLLSIETGDKLVAYASDDTIILKTLRLPSEAEFEMALAKSQSMAKSLGYKESDVVDLVKSVRKNKRK